MNVPEGTYLATGSQKFAILGGDPDQNGVAGYYAADENGFGVSDELYTWTQTSFFPPYEYFIVFAYEDGTNVTVEDVETGEIYFSGVLNDGSSERVIPTIPGRWRNYYERIIRNEGAMNRIRSYIINNPSKW